MSIRESELMKTENVSSAWSGAGVLSDVKIKVLLRTKNNQKNKIKYRQIFRSTTTYVYDFVQKNVYCLHSSFSSNPAQKNKIK